MILRTDSDPSDWLIGNWPIKYVFFKFQIVFKFSIVLKIIENKKYGLFNLDNVLRTEKLELPEKLAMCAQLLEGVCHLEKIGMSHRDIKPDNIFIKNDHTFKRVYLADFGCSGTEFDIFYES